MKRFQNYIVWVWGEMTGGKPESTRTSTTGLSTAVAFMSARLSTTVQVVHASRVATTFTAWTLTWDYTVTAGTPRKSTKSTATADIPWLAWRNTGIADNEIEGNDEQKYHNQSIAIVRGLHRDWSHRKGFHASLFGRCVSLSLTWRNASLAFLINVTLRCFSSRPIKAGLVIGSWNKR